MLVAFHNPTPSIVLRRKKIAIANRNEYLPVNKHSSPPVEQQNPQKNEPPKTRLTSGFVKNIHPEKERANNSPKATKNTS